MSSPSELEVEVSNAQAQARKREKLHGRSDYFSPALVTRIERYKVGNWQAMMSAECVATLRPSFERKSAATQIER